MHTYICSCIHAYMHTCICSCIHAYMHTYICSCRHAYDPVSSPRWSHLMNLTGSLHFTRVFQSSQVFSLSNRGRGVKSNRGLWVKPQAPPLYLTLHVRREFHTPDRGPWVKHKRPAFLWPWWPAPTDADPEHRSLCPRVCQGLGGSCCVFVQAVALPWSRCWL